VTGEKEQGAAAIRVEQANAEERTPNPVSNRLLAGSRNFGGDVKKLQWGRLLISDTH